MRKIWSVSVDGKTHGIDVDWDILMTGSGRVLVDGEVARQWGFGTKWPGVSKAFRVGNKVGTVTQSWFDFDLSIEETTIPRPLTLRGHASQAAIFAVLMIAFLILALGLLAAFASVRS